MDDDTKVNETQAQEEIEDNDTNTRDIEDTQNDDFTSLSKRISAMEENQNRMLGVIQAMQKAQENFVEMGGTISENDDVSANEDGFVPLEKLDFTI